MRLYEEAKNKFLDVRDNISQTDHPQAYRLAFSKPLKFYLDKTTDESIAELIKETE